MNTLYLECETGISGDMMVAALLDLGASEAVLNEGLKSLSLDGYKTEISYVKKAGLQVCDFNVILEKNCENHDHDMEYLYGHLENQDHHHEHSHEHGQDFHHDHNHNHSHAHRGIKEIYEIIDKSGISDNAKIIAKKIFDVIALAEAKAHGESVENVHFHEVGAIDSIVDIVAVAICVDNLSIDEVIVPYLAEGRGSVRCQHGILPIPVPAVVNIVTKHGIALKNTNTEGELITPTGAAIVGALRTKNSLPEKYIVKKVGLGAGKRNYKIPSILRAMLIEESHNYLNDSIYKLETNIDDCTGEMLGNVMDKLLSAGAKDVFFTPIFMKKNRPGYMLSVICTEDKVEDIENIIFMQTTTIGIRKVLMDRRILLREEGSIETKFGKLLIKKCTLPDGNVRMYPEYESVKKLAEDSNVSFQDVINEFRKI